MESPELCRLSAKAPQREFCGALLPTPSWARRQQPSPPSPPAGRLNQSGPEGQASTFLKARSAPRRSVSTCGRSVDLRAAEDRWERSEHYAYVEPERPLLDVLAIEKDYVLEIHDCGSAAHLPKSGDAWLRVETPKVMILIMLEIRFEEGARSDKRHIADEHVDELREFVEAPAAEEATKPGNARISRNFEKARIAGVVQVRQPPFLEVGANAHRTELEHSESLPTKASPILSEEYRTRGIQSDCHRECEIDGRQDHQRQKSANDVGDPLCNERRRLEDRRAQLEKRLIVVPDELRTNIRDSNAARRVKNLCAGQQTFFHDLGDHRWGQRPRDDDRFDMISLDDVTEVVYRRGVSVQVTGELVIASGRQERGFDLGIFWTVGPDNQSCRGSATTRPQFPQKPIGETPLREKHSPSQNDCHKINCQGCGPPDRKPENGQNEKGCQGGRTKQANAAVQSPMAAIAPRDKKTEEKRGREIDTVRRVGGERMTEAGAKHGALVEKLGDCLVDH